MIPLSTAWLLAALAVQTATWPLTGLHGARVPFSKLPPADRAIAQKLLHPELGPLFQGEAPQTIDRTIANFTTEPLTLGALRALAVQANGGELCGASGNCNLWIIDLQHRTLLLRATGVQSYLIDRTPPHTPPDIVTNTHNSATEYELIRWHYENAIYTAQTCATLDYADPDGNPLKQPKITPHPCGSEGN